MRNLLAPAALGLSAGVFALLPHVGLVIGSLPFLLVHGESLVAAAAWGLGEAGVTIVDDSVPWEGLVEADEPLVLHDSLCPLTPPDFIAAWRSAIVASSSRNRGGCWARGSAQMSSTAAAPASSVLMGPPDQRLISS